MKTISELFRDSYISGENEFIINELNKIITPCGEFKGGYRASQEAVKKETGIEFTETYWLLMETALIKIIYTNKEINYEIYKRDMIVSIRKNFKIRVIGKIVSELQEIVLELINGKLIILAIPKEPLVLKKDYYELVDLLIS